jgi:hypothetical protein
MPPLDGAFRLSPSCPRSPGNEVVSRRVGEVVELADVLEERAPSSSLDLASTV